MNTLTRRATEGVGFAKLSIPRFVKCSLSLARRVSVLLLMWILPSIVFADEPAPAVKHIFVPVDKVESWPKGDWVPVPFEEYLARREVDRKSNRPRVKSRIEWQSLTANFDPARGVLTNGNWLAEVRGAGEARWELMSLEPLDLAVSELRWSDGEAVWGSTPSGDPQLVVEPGAKRLEGKWSLTSRRLPRTWQFDVRLATATVSELKLRIPANLSLRSSAGQVKGPLATGEENWRLWQVHLGSQSRCELLVLESRPAAQTEPVVVYEQTSSYVLRDAEIELQCEINVELFHTPKSSLMLTVPDDLTVYSIGFSGDARLPWRELPRVAGQSRLVEVALPEPQIGKVRALQVLAGSVAKFDPNWSLPKITLSGGWFTAGRWNVSVEAPLTWRLVKPTGMRLTEVDASSPTVRRMSFLQYLADATLILDVSSPEPRLSADVLQRLTAEENEWLLTSEWHWQVVAGSAFATRCRVPAGWEILEVKSLSNAPGQEVRHWDVLTEANGDRTLVCEFAQGLEGRSISRVRIEASRARSTTEQRETFECLSPLDCHHAEVLLSVALPTGWRWNGGNDAVPAPSGLPRLSAQWPSFELWKSEAATWDETTLLSRGVQLNGPLKVPMSIVRAEVGPDVDAATSAPAASVDLEQSADNESRNGTEIVDHLVWTRAELRSLIFPGDDGFDRHRLSLESASATRVGRLEFDLAGPAELVSVRMNGVRAETQHEGVRYRLPSIPKGGLRSLEIEYRLPSDRDFFRNRQTLPVPQVTGTVLGFRWLFALPPDARLGDEPSGLRLQQPLDPTPWLRRLFGPLGRDDAAAWFNPFQDRSWRELWQPKSVREEIGLSAVEPFAPPGWRVREAIGPGLPRDINWLTFQATQVHTLAWLGMLFSTGVGCWLRVRRSAPRVHIAAIWLGLSLVGVMLSDPVTAEVLGGCLVGTLMAVLLPRRLLMSYSNQNEAKARGAFDVTVAYQRAGGAGLVALLIAWQGLMAQETSPKGIGEFEVLVPVADPAEAITENVRPAGEPALVHVSKSLWEYWQRRAEADSSEPSVLLSSADYGVSVVGEQSTVRAEYVVQRLQPDRAETLRFPFASVPLGGSEACLVDGQPRAVRVNETRDTLLLELPPLEQSRPDDGSSKIVTQKVTFALLPRVISTGTTSRLSLALPTIVNSRLTLTAPAIGPVDVMTRRGEISNDAVTAISNAQLGPMNQLRIDWSPAGVVRPRSVAEVTVDLFCLAELTPTGLRQRYRAKCSVSSGEVSALNWLIPAGVVIRDSEITADNLLQWSLEPHGNGQQQLTLEFARPHAKEFMIDVTGMQSVIGSSESPRWVPWQIASNGDAGTRVKSGLFALGVATLPGFKVTLPMPLPEHVAPLAENVFLRGWSGTTLPRPPQLVVQLTTPAELPFQLAAVTSLRKARQELLLHFGRDSFDWTLYAEVSSSGAPTFQHEVLLAAPFRPDEVSVSEDEAERLVSWSAADSRAILFLRGETTGIQNVTVHGREAIPADGRLTVPTRWLAEAELAEFSLRVTHDPSWQVQVQDERDQELLPVETRPPQPGRAELFLGKFRADAMSAALRVRLTPHEPAGASEAWTIIAPADQETWTLRHVERLVGGGLITARLFWPSAWATNGTVRLAPSLKELARKPLPDGVELTVQSLHRSADGESQGQSASRDIVFEVTLPMKDRSQALVAPPMALDLETRQHQWLLSDELGSWLPDNHGAVMSDVASLPEWMKPVLPPGNRSWLRLSGESELREFVRSNKGIVQRLPKSLWMDTAVWLADGEISQGRTWLLVQSNGTSELAIGRPEGIRWQAVFVDESFREISDADAESDTLRIDRLPAGPLSLVTLFWQVDEQHRKRIVARRDTALPMPTDSSLQPERHDLTLLSAGFSDLSSTHGARRVPDWDVRLSRANQIARALRTDSARSSVSCARLLRQLDEDVIGAQRLIDQLPDEVGGGSIARDQLQATLAEVEALKNSETTVTSRAAVKSQSASPANQPFKSWTSHSWLNVPAGWSAIAETDSNARLSIILVDRRWVRWIIAVVALIAVIPLFRMWLRWQTSEWLANHSFLAWASLALIWWACLNPSVVGFTLLLVAAIFAIREQWVAPNSVATH